MRTYDIALALALALFCPTSALGDEIFAGVANYGSGGEGPNAVVQQAAQGVADRLIAQSPSFVLSGGDMLYGTYPSDPFLDFEPLGPTGNPSFEVAVGDLYGQYIKQSALVPNGGTEMNFFPVVGDHDWHHETIQVNVETGYSVGPALEGYNVNVNKDTNPAFYGAALTAYNDAQSYLSGANTNHSNTQFGLSTSVANQITIFGAPNTPENGDTYESYFSALYHLTTSQTASTQPIRWYDTLQGNVHVFALSTDPNEIFQGGLKSIDIQDSGTSAYNLANSPQGQWFTAALSASPATWNIVETHQPIVSASTPQEGYYSSGVTPLGHMSTAYMQWFDNTKVDLVLSAHVHGFERLYNNGITYINNGTGGTYQSFHYFCEQPGATNSCENTYQVDPNFGGSSGTTWSNNDMIALTQMQVGNTYGFQLFQTSDTNNYLESQFWGSTDPANANGNGANWTLLDDFFILKNGRISASQAQSATGLELKALNGASNGFGIIDTSGATGPITLAALINGPGQLVVNGGGTLILTRPNVPTSAPSVYSGQNFSFMPASAKNTYSGGTYLTGGSTLQIANNSLLGASSGALTLDAGMLKASQGFSSARAIVLGSGNGAINTNGNQVALSGQITGTGALTKIGANKLILSGISNYTGPTVVNQGGLAVNGAIISDVAVNSGGMLGGTGTVGNTQVNSGGILTPGNSIGTITVNGNLAFGAGGQYAVEVSPTAADRTNVT
ncbi:MAG: autotransporter-associated beta strand repeat-containing protein, partial [Rhodoplanes sp.]